MNLRLFALAATVGLVLHGFTPAHAEPTADDRFVMVDAELTVVPGHDPDYGRPDRGGTYPQFAGYCAAQYSPSSCGGLRATITLTNLDAHPRPTPPDCFPGQPYCIAGDFHGTATLHRVFGCETRSGSRVPAFDRATTTTSFVSGTTRGFLYLPPVSDGTSVTMRTMYSIPAWEDHPRHCPAGLRLAQWEITYRDVSVTLESSHYPVWTYDLGSATWRSDQLDGRGPPGRR